MGLFSIFSKKNNEINKEITEEKNVVSENESVKETDKENESAIENAVVSENKTDEIAVETSEVKNNSSEEKKKNKISFFQKLRKTRENLSYGLSALVKGRKIDDDLYDDLETSLLTADLGVETTQKVIEKLKKESKLRELHDASALKDNLKNILNEILKDCAEPLNIEKNTNMPYVILMVGVNGAGKTTTIGKLASKFKAQGLKVMLAAGDTFRAAAVEQLKSWGERCNIPVVSQPTGSDSASVIYDALSSAIAHKADVLICDTAGRLQNKDNLMEELKKITRVMKKHSESVPNEVMLVLDSTTGQNAISQMKIFSQAVNVTGITLTKLDGTAKGGIIFALSDQFKVPVRYIGIGEKVEDLREFDSESFVDALVD
ncbi:MAG: signal recognition particle-docking protein FtsY [Succinivibrio sp.]|nr:signal recognition particle-docking protein FtsY [Succinivibrio sp.]